MNDSHKEIIIEENVLFSSHNENKCNAIIETMISTVVGLLGKGVAKVISLLLALGLIYIWGRLITEGFGIAGTLARSLFGENGGLFKLIFMLIGAVVLGGLFLSGIGFIVGLTKVSLNSISQKCEEYKKQDNLNKIEIKKAEIEREAKESMDLINTRMIGQKMIKECNNFKQVNSKYVEIMNKKTENISSDAQYEFLKNEIENIDGFLRSKIKSSVMYEDSEIKNVVDNKKSSIHENITAIYKYLSKNKESYVDSKIYKCKNQQDIIYKFMETCNYNNIQTSSNLKSNILSNINSHKSFLSDNIKEMFIQYSGIKKGYDGEAKVDEHLSLYKDILTNLSNVRLELEGTSIETDNVIITNKGIFLSEVKNYGSANDKITISKDGKWRRFSGKKEVPISNIQEQHNRHIGIMQRFINSEFKSRGYDLPYIAFEPIIVIANDKIEIENNSDIVVLRSSNIYDYVKNFKSEYSLSKEVQLEIKNILKNNMKELKKYPITSYEDALKSRIEFIINEVEKLKCYDVLQDSFLNGIDEQNLKINIKNILWKNNRIHDNSYVYIKKN